jgi:replicative DNA helicase
MLKDSKTGKQGACDFILAMGKDESVPDQRYLSLPKNKLVNSVTAKKCPKAAVYFDGVRGTFYEHFVDEQTKAELALALTADIKQELPAPF